MPRAANLAEIHRFGEVAAVIRAAMTLKGLTSVDVAREIGLAGPTSVSGWVTAKAAPAPKWRDKLAAVLEVPAASLVGKPRDAVAVVRKPPPKPPEAVPGAVPAAVERGGPKLVSSVEVLTFSVDSLGRARIRLDVALPVAQAMPLMRLLMDQGLINGERGS